MKPLLSILTPACWERMPCALVPQDGPFVYPAALNFSRRQTVDGLHCYIKAQIDALKEPRMVEHLVLFDNRTRSVGLKRQALLDSALGDYIAFVDDDDDVSDDYVIALLTAIIQHAPDVITFEQDAHHDHFHSRVIFGINNPDENFNTNGGITKRNVWQVCAIRREIARRGIFPDIMDGEDRAWCAQIRPFLRTSHHIDKILHTYRHSTQHTLATGKTKPGE